MDKLNNNQIITPESVLLSVKELFSASSERLDRELEKSSAKFKQELKESREEFDQRMKASNEAFEKSREEFNQSLKTSREEFDQRMKVSNEAFEKSREDFDRRMKSLNEHLGGIVESNGAVAEDYFFNSLENGHINFFINEGIYGIMPNVKGRTVNDEYDIVFTNGTTVGIVECKYKARKDDIPKMLKKPATYRTNFPLYKNHKVYLALAAFTIDEHCQRECIKQGIAVIKPVGDTVVIKNEHLKTF